MLSSLDGIVEAEADSTGHPCCAAHACTQRVRQRRGAELSRYLVGGSPVTANGDDAIAACVDEFEICLLYTSDAADE